MCSDTVLCGQLFHLSVFILFNLKKLKASMLCAIFNMLIWAEYVSVSQMAFYLYAALTDLTVTNESKFRRVHNVLPMRLFTSSDCNHSFASGIVSIVGQRLVLDLRGYESCLGPGQFDPPSSDHGINGATVVFAAMRLPEDGMGEDLEMTRMGSHDSDVSEVVFTKVDLEQPPAKIQPPSWGPWETPSCGRIEEEEEEEEGEDIDTVNVAGR